MRQLEDGTYELTLADRIHDHLLITVPFLIGIAGVIATIYIGIVHSPWNAIEAGFLTAFWWMFWWLAWFGPR